MARPDHFRVMPGYKDPINTNLITSYSPNNPERNRNGEHKVCVHLASGERFVVENRTMAGFELAMWGTKETTDAAPI